MKELKVLDRDSLATSDRGQMLLLVLDEEQIKCATLRHLEEVIKSSGMGIVLAMPDQQYRKGLRGWAKAHILAAVAGVAGVLPLSGTSMQSEQESGWGKVIQPGPLTWVERTTIETIALPPTPPTILSSGSEQDRQMLDRARDLVSKSNCWLDPAGCVFTKDGQIVMEAVSTSYNNSHCKGIPLDWRELPLNPGERLMFCDSQHAEREGVGAAAKAGIKLEDTSAYVTKFPCRACALSLISAGVRRVVFGEGSYGLNEADVLGVQGVELVKVNRD